MYLNDYYVLHENILSPSSSSNNFFLADRPRFQVNFCSTTWKAKASMKRDLPAAIREVASFINIELNETDIAALADYLDVKNMKKNPAVNHQDRHQR
jgi:hypothetical protein